MNRNISICFIILSITIIVILTIQIKSEEKEIVSDYTTEYEEEERFIQVNGINEYYKYEIRCVDMRLEVFLEDGSLYMETGINYDDLPDETRQKIDKGLKFKDDIELYDFLESYSS